MTVEMEALSPRKTSSSLNEQDARTVVAGSEHTEFIKDFLEDVRTTRGCEPKAAHSQWSKA